MLERYNGHLCICFKTTPQLQQLLVEDAEHYFVTPYIGKQGWVSMIADGRLNWRDIGQLVRQSHQLVSRAQTSMEKGVKSVSRSK